MQKVAKTVSRAKPVLSEAEGSQRAPSPGSFESRVSRLVLNPKPETRDPRQISRAWRLGAIIFSIFAGLIVPSFPLALEVPELGQSITDLAGMMPQVSALELKERLKQFSAQTGRTVAVLTVPSLEGEAIETYSRRAFEKLPLATAERDRAVLLVVARKDRQVGVEIGAELRHLFPQPAATEKLQHHVSPYYDGMRPDLGIHAGVDYIFKIIKGKVRVDTMTEKERLEEESLSGHGAGGIFSLLLAPYLAFIVGGLWGIYATNLGVQRGIRLFIGAVLGSGTAKIIAMVMSFMGSYGDSLWYFILGISIPVAVLGSWTEFWMSGDWSGIPRVKDPIKRRPEDNMGI